MTDDVRLSDDQAAIKRRQRIAEMLMAQGQEPMEQQMAGGYVVPISPLAGVAKVAQQLAGAYINKKADEESDAYKQKKMDAFNGMDFNAPDVENQLAKQGFIDEAIKIKMKKAENTNRYQPTNQVVMGDDGKLRLRRFGSDPSAPVLDDSSIIPNSLRWVDNGAEFVPVETKGYAENAVQRPDQPVSVTISKDANEWDRQKLEEIAAQNGVDPVVAGTKSVQKQLTPDQQIKYNPDIQAQIAGSVEAAKQAEKTTETEKQTESKPLPAPAFKLQMEATDALSNSSQTSAKMDAIINKMESGELKFGPLENLTNEAGLLTNSKDKSVINYGEALTDFKRLQNDSLRLNKGVQTEGDSQREWESLFRGLYNNESVKRQLQKIKAINEEGARLQKEKIKQIRMEYGKGDINTSGFESQLSVDKVTPKESNSFPKVGIVEDGYRFKGGNPDDPNNWEKIQ